MSRLRVQLTTAKPPVAGHPDTEGRMADTLQFEAPMRRALDLASRGPVTGGNPQVGAVLVDAEGRIVAEGWHRGAGSPHAEVDALSKVGGDARGLTAVVTLEPCNHTGRTGPCTEALLAAGVERVVFGATDPGPISGHGAERLAEGGVEVHGGVLRDEAEALLHPWLEVMRRGRPWVTVKWASTLDGRAAAPDGSSQWITGMAARQRVHEQRALSDAILVGTGTVLADDPSLTARGDAGELLPSQPLPVVVGERPIPTDAALHRHPRGVVETGTRDLAAILEDLHTRAIRRVYVEGGPTLASAVIAGGFADEYAVYLAPAVLGGPGLAIGDLGIPSIGEARRLRIDSVERLGDDLLVLARQIARPEAASDPTGPVQRTGPTRGAAVPRPAPQEGD